MEKGNGRRETGEGRREKGERCRGWACPCPEK